MYRYLFFIAVILLAGCGGKSNPIKEDLSTKENKSFIATPKKDNDVKRDGMTDCERESLSTNHDECPPTEAKLNRSKNFAEEKLNIKGVKVIDYRNDIYEYKGQRFYINRQFDFILRYPKDMQNGDEAFSSDGNHFYTKDSTVVLKACISYYDVFSVDFTLKQWLKHCSKYTGEILFYKEYGAKYFISNGINKEGLNFIRKGIYHQAYDREVIVFLEVYFKGEHQKEAWRIWKYAVSKFPNNPFEE